MFLKTFVAMIAIDVNIILVFFIYGLAFFSMGLVMLMEAGRSPLIVGTKALYWLSIFGFTHGIHEWLEVAINQSEKFTTNFSVQFGLLRIGFLAVSFLPLILFGLQVLLPHHKFNRREVTIGLAALVIYLFWMLFMTIFTLRAHADWVRHTDALVRYTLAVPGAFLTGLALNQQGRGALKGNRPRLRRYLRWAGSSFILYGLTQIFVPPADFFPANLVNSQAFNQVIGLPIQVLRAAVAVVATVSLLRATQEAETIRQSQYETVQLARLEALEQIKSEILEREDLRRELLRHTVVAQEEERARIARELHDDTAQLLTAFSLNLAALQDHLPEDQFFRKMLVRLQSLSRQMSQGIYRMVHDLRPAQLDDLGLVAALNYLADDEPKRTGVVVDFSIIGVRQRLEPLMETVLFRVAQEALANVARHAQVKQATMELNFKPHEVVLTVVDYGIGFDTQIDLIPPRGWGLAGMRERAESLDGELLIESAPGSGTVVKVVIPILAQSTMAIRESL
jgi:signal transduction histidine kinase